MKHLSYTKKGELFHPLKWWKTDFITEVAIYQGDRGANPPLDFIVKYKEENKRLRTPSHTHWIVDLITKSEGGKQQLNLYINDLIEIYNTSLPFKSQEERITYHLKYPNLMANKHKVLTGRGHYSIETLTSFVELFSICEKQSPNAFMFKGLLTLLKDYSEGKKDFYQVVGLSKRV